MKIICLTPVKNESWILDRFLAATSLWADVIIVVDQNSTDGSREIAGKYSKVRLIENEATDFNEPERQQLLISEARKIAGPRLLIALDADEFLPGDLVGNQAKFDEIRLLEPGTVIKFHRIGILPDYRQYWYETSADLFTFGFVDNGAMFKGIKIHSTRVPVPVDAHTKMIPEVCVMHYQYVAWERMLSKQAWYLAWERINQKHHSPAARFRYYNRLFGALHSGLLDLSDSFYSGYDKAGVNLRTSLADDSSSWDTRVLALLAEHGHARFRRDALWFKDWEQVAINLNLDNIQRFRDPRNPIQKLVHWWLRYTRSRPDAPMTQFIDKILWKLKL